MSWKRSGIYLHRTRKPYATLGIPLRVTLAAGVVLAVVMAFTNWFAGQEWFWWLPLLLPIFSGRHNAYVGHTSSRFHRDNQHKLGSSTWGKASAAWADLDLKIYSLPCAFPRSKQAREIQEWLYIKLLLPVYNVEHNKTNPRKITRGKAQSQRWAREQGGMRRWVPRTLRLGLYLTVGMALIYSGWEKWT